MKEYHNLSIEETYQKLNSSEKGLSQEEAEARLSRYGKNALEEGKSKSWLQRFFAQMKDLMIIVLLFAALISAIIAIIEKNYTELIDSGIILLIVIVNAVIGTVQESKADQAMKELTKMNKPNAKVLRNGEITKIKCEDIVIGDIVILEAGDVVPADLRLTLTKSLKIQESTLTGESVPSEKDCSVLLDDATPLGDRKNMAYSTGVVTYGRGMGVVVDTGMKTEVGKIAGMLNTQEKSDTPLQKQLAKTAKLLSIIVLGIAVVIFIAGIINSLSTSKNLIDSIIGSFMTAVAIAVAAIPEGLPAVVTIVLAIGVKRMSERKAIVKNLPAVETLGCCEVICSDKTGTLTLNKMTVKEFYTPSMGLFYKEEKVLDNSVNMLIQGMVLCNDTEEKMDEELVGDPTETALVAYAKKIGINVKELKSYDERIDEIPFDSKRKLMTTVHLNKDDEKVSYTKGAFDMLLQRCTKILVLDKVRNITEEDKLELKKANKEMGSNALRVLGLAYKSTHLNDHDKLEEDLIFVGLVGMIDPPRKEVEGAVATCRKAGMTAIMITGDHLDTAVAIATQIGIYRKGDKAITGAELDKLTDEEFLRDLKKYKVFARVSPENKVRIVNAYKTFNIIVAMTGDGVNDAPSIKTADIGIGMGITGTDVSKGAADIVLADDNFATIIAAVEEGRKVYSNIKKAVQYLLSANIAEVLCLFITTIFLKVEFLSAVMILWVNLVTDSFPALALGCERVEKDIMNQPPRKAKSSLFAGHTGKNILVQGIIQTALTMLSFSIGGYVLSDGIVNHKVAMTMAFVTLCLIQLFHSYNSRSQTHSLFTSNPFKNRMLNLAFVVGAGLTALTFIPAVQTFFGTTMLSVGELFISIGCAFAIIPLVELQKFIEYLIKRNKQKKIQNFVIEEQNEVDSQN
ncbi:MAG TPA: calcium-translocating P-type ATPase, PMCA-type [Clostridiales bacterium]|nr:calcium-translocating P-type ATPase, PMCA-type [Clostridiales bacterium]